MSVVYKVISAISNIWNRTMLHVGIVNVFIGRCCMLICHVISASNVRENDPCISPVCCPRYSIVGENNQKPHFASSGGPETRVSLSGPTQQPPSLR